MCVAVCIRVNECKILKGLCFVPEMEVVQTERVSKTQMAYMYMYLYVHVHAQIKKKNRLNLLYTCTLHITPCLHYIHVYI